MKFVNGIEYLIGFASKDEILEQIIDVPFDYDGYESSKDLKGLIDELVELATYGLTLDQ